MTTPYSTPSPTPLSFAALGFTSLALVFSAGCDDDPVSLSDAGADARPPACCVANPGGDQTLCDQAEPLGRTRCENVAGGQCSWVTGPACEDPDAGAPDDAGGSDAGGDDAGSTDGGSVDGGEPSCCAAYDPADSALCAGFGPADCEAKTECHPVLDAACDTCCTGPDPDSAATCATLSYEGCTVTRPCVVASGPECMPTEPSCCLAERPEDAAICAPLSASDCELEAPRCYVSTDPACTPSCCRGVETHFDAECAGLPDARCEALDQCVVASGPECTPTEPSCCLAERPEDAAICAPLSATDCALEAPRCYVSTDPACTPTCCRGVEARFEAECAGLPDARCEALDQCVVATGAECAG